jgi:type IV pilus assembly protein PilO
MDLGLDQLTGAFEKLGKLPKSHRTIILPVIAVLVCAAYVYFLYLPASRNLDQIRDQHLQLQRKLAEVRTVAGNEEAVKQEIAALEKKLEIALRQLPNSKELPVLLTDITSLGKNAGLEFKAFRPQEETRRDFYAEVPIDIEFVGDFHEVASFFDELSRLPRIVNVGSLDVAISSESSLATVLQVKGDATTFRFLDDAAKQQGAPEGEKAPAKTSKSARRGH